MLQWIAVYLQCGAVYCSACVAVYCSVVQCGTVWCSVLQFVAVCCSVLQCVAVCCSVLQCVAVCLQCVAACCSVLQLNEKSLSSLSLHLGVSLLLHRSLFYICWVSFCIQRSLSAYIGLFSRIEVFFFSF